MEEHEAQSIDACRPVSSSSNLTAFFTPSKSPKLSLGELRGVEMSDELGILLAADRFPTPRNLPIRNFDQPNPEDRVEVVLLVTSEEDLALMLVDVGVGEEAGGGGAEPVTMG